MCSRLLTATLLVALGALLGSRWTRPEVSPVQAQEKAAIAGPLTDAELGTLLKNLGYTTNERRTKDFLTYDIDMSIKGISMIFHVGISPSREWLWVDTGMFILPQDKLTPERLEAVLAANSLSPGQFRLYKNDKDKWFGFSTPRSNVGVGPVELRKHLDLHVLMLTSTEALWNPAKWTSTPTSQPTVPKAAETNSQQPTRPTPRP